MFQGFCVIFAPSDRHQIPLQSFRHIKSPQEGEASARHHDGGGLCVAVAWPRFDFVVVGGVIGADVDSVRCGANGELVRWVRKSPPMWWAVRYLWSCGKVLAYAVSAVLIAPALDVS